jgi:hypothetical protein
MPGMRLAKPDEDDFDTTRQFLQLCERFWDSRPKYSLRREEDEWRQWENDDPDYKEVLKLRRSIAEEEGIALDDVDDRILVYEFLRLKYKKCDTNWGRVIMTASVLLDNACDPTLDYLEFFPGFECFHVAPEQ